MANSRGEFARCRPPHLMFWWVPGARPINYCRCSVSERSGAPRTDELLFVCIWCVCQRRTQCTHHSLTAFNAYTSLSVLLCPAP